MNEKYLRQLSISFPTIKSASAEIINLSANLNLPKGTEHFVSDIHGEFEAFSHIIKNSSGNIRRKIDDEFNDELDDKQKRLLGTLIYYPEEKLDLIEKSNDNIFDFYRWALYCLIRVARRTATKYTREKLKKAVKPEYEYIVEELLNERDDTSAKELYYKGIIEAIISTDSSREYIVVLSRLIQHLSIDRLHIIGDVFDRGSNAEGVMDLLCKYHSVDIEWGNHDIEWMGAACGSLACIASVIRICVKYGNLKTLENGYGISLVPLVTFALDKYKNDPCDIFKIKMDNLRDSKVYSKVHKAIAIILLKLEGDISRRHPEFEMQNRVLLDKLDLTKGIIDIDGREYELKDNNFPTLDINNPFKLSDDEQYVMDKLLESFLSSEKLQRHVDALYNRGSMYRVYNGNLLFHGCIPLNENGRCMYVNIDGKKVKGKELFETLERLARNARYSKNKHDKEYGLDVMYFMWASPVSPLFGKEKMATFERYFLNNDEIKYEAKNSYYTYYYDPVVVKRIFDEFNIDFKTGHIINGHVPVKLGSSPIHCGGRVIIIDGGFSKAYQPVTGIAGYTLVSNSHCLKLVSHKPFISTSDAIINETNIHSDSELISVFPTRQRVLDTDKGKDMVERINDLNELIECYKNGSIHEHQ